MQQLNNQSRERYPANKSTPTAKIMRSQPTTSSSIQPDLSLSNNASDFSKNRDFSDRSYKKGYLWAALPAVGAADEPDMAAAVLVAASVPSLESLQHRRSHGENISSRRQRRGEKRSKLELYTMISP